MSPKAVFGGEQRRAIQEVLEAGDLINTTGFPGMKSGRAFILESPSWTKQGLCLPRVQGCKGKRLMPSLLDLLGTCHSLWQQWGFTEPEQDFTCSSEEMNEIIVSCAQQLLGNAREVERVCY